MGGGSFGREVELDMLVEEIQNHIDELGDVSIHNSMITLRLEEGGPAYTIYRTGTFQIRGAKTKKVLEKAVADFQKVLSNIGFETPDIQFEHKTSVFIEDLNQQLDLEMLGVALGFENIEYEPEQFPGLIYRPPMFEATLLIFANGKINIGGTTSRQEAEAAVDYLEEQISSQIENHSSTKNAS